MTYDISYRRILAKMGYYDYQSGLIRHHFNQEDGWVSHQEHSREFILKALDLNKPKKVTVLGSGWLLELPFAEIINKIPEICLVDIIHPPDVVNQVKDLKNVKLIEQDVTGGLIAEVWAKTGRFNLFRKVRTLSNILIPDYDLDDPGLIISLNLLTQLEVLPVKFVKSRSKINEAELTAFRAEIQRKHISFLMKHQSVIISDIAEVAISKTGITSVTSTLFTEMPPGKISEEWTWNFDKAGGELYNSTRQFKVKALIN